MTTNWFLGPLGADNGRTASGGNLSYSGLETPNSNPTSVQQWSRMSNASLYHPELAIHAMKYLQEVTAFRSRILNTFIEDFRDDPGSALPHLQMFLTTPAARLGTAFRIERVERTDTIFEVARVMTQHELLVIAGREDALGILQKDVLWGSKPFFYKVLTCLDFDQEVQTILQDVQELPTMHYSTCTVYEVLRVMCVSHVETVGLVDDSESISSVIKFADVYEAFVKELTDIYDDPDRPRAKNASEQQNLLLTSKQVEGSFEDDGDGILRPRTIAEGRSLKNALEGKAHISRFRKMAQEWVESPFTEFLIMLLLCLDLSLTIWEAATPNDSKDQVLQGSTWSNPLMVVTGAILFVFTFEAMVRVLGYGRSLINGTRILDTLDIGVVIVSIGVYLFTLSTDAEKTFKIVTFARVIRFMRILKFARRLRKWVGSNKRRYRKDGFDLDLTYITPSCIAMSLPALGSEANYRNPIDDVVRFFTRYHKEQFLIFNLCSERSYDESYFGGRVLRIKVDDHNPPFFEQLIQFIHRAEQFMGESPHNVIAVHCKVGKGRTGVFVCAWLLYSQFKTEVEEALAHFAQRRTGNGARAQQGVSGASQRRYLHYFHTALKKGGYRANKLRLVKIRLHTCPHMDRDGGCDPWITLEQGGQKVFSSRESGCITSPVSEDALQCEKRISLSQSHVVNMSKNDAYVDFQVDMDVVGDMRLVFYDHDTLPPSDEVGCFLWFHTGFITDAVTDFTKDEIDMAFTDTKCRIFDADFKISFYFSDVPKAAHTFMSPRLFHQISAEGGGDATASDGGGISHRRSSVKPHLGYSSSVATMRSLSCLGAFRDLPPPHARTLERSAQYRGGGYNGLGTIRETFTIEMDEPEGEEINSLTPIPDNLCVAQGPLVRHDGVQLVSLNAAAALSNQATNAHSNPHEKKLINYYKNVSKGGPAPSRAVVSNKIRALVSLNKKRFEEDGFNLDLTYITPRLIAMGYPAATGIEGRYRNSADDVYRFFQERHSGHFRIVNLVAERGYDLDMYHGAVAIYPFMDHNPPAMELLLPACVHIHQFLQAKDNNVVAVHCKAGKGRTGLILVCYLLFGGLQRRAVSARRFYDTQRCHDKKGLTIISQIRYAHYFQEYLRRLKNEIPCPVTETLSPAITLLAVEMNKIPCYHGSGCEPSLRVAVRNEADHIEYVLFSSKAFEVPRKMKADEEGGWYLSLVNIVDDGSKNDVVSSRIDGHAGIRVAGDIKIIINHNISTLMGSKEEHVLHVWVHSIFMETPPDQMAGVARVLEEEECRMRDLPLGTRALKFQKHEIDGAAKDHKNTHFAEDFSFEVFWQYLQDQCGSGDALVAAVAEKDGIQDSGKSLKYKAGGSTYKDKDLWMADCADRKEQLLQPLTMEQFLLKPAMRNDPTPILSALHEARTELKTVGSFTKQFVQRNSSGSDNEDVQEVSPLSPAFAITTSSDDETEPVMARMWLEHVNSNSSFSMLSDVVLQTSSDQTSLVQQSPNMPDTAPPSLSPEVPPREGPPDMIAIVPPRNSLLVSPSEAHVSESLSAPYEFTENADLLSFLLCQSEAPTDLTPGPEVAPDLPSIPHAMAADLVSGLQVTHE